MAAHFKLGRACGCGTPVSDESKTGNCLRCNLRKMNTDPVLKEQRAEAFRRKLRDDPAEMERRRMQIKINRRNGMKSPVAQANRRRAAMQNLEKAYAPEARAKQLASIPAAVRKGWDKKLSWCPKERRAEYHALIRRGHKTSGEAKQIILDRISAEAAALSPFERQMRALENGAKIVANDRKPMFGEALRA